MYEFWKFPCKPASTQLGNSVSLSTDPRSLAWCDVSGEQKVVVRGRVGHVVGVGEGRVWLEDDEQDERRGDGLWTDWSVPSVQLSETIVEDDIGIEKFSQLVNDSFALIGRQLEEKEGRRSVWRKVDQEFRSTHSKGKEEVEDEKEEEYARKGGREEEGEGKKNELFDTMMAFLSWSFSLLIRHLTLPGRVLQWIRKMRTIISFETKKNFLRSSLLPSSAPFPIHIDRAAAQEAKFGSHHVDLKDERSISHFLSSGFFFFFSLSFEL